MPQVAEPDDELGLQYIVVHGHRRAFRAPVRDPRCSSCTVSGATPSTWLAVMPRLAEHFTVIAPDLLGHGASDKPRADYTLGAFANGMRDLLTLLGFDKATVVGHSFGGGVAMQLSRSGISLLRDLDEVAMIYDHLCDGPSRRAVRHVTSSVVDWRGQVVSMTDRAYLTQLMPMCVVWGSDDRVIPAFHSTIVSSYAPGAQVHVLEDSGHFPHKDHPDAFVDIVTAFVESTDPATYHRGRWRSLMRRGDVGTLTSVDPNAEATAA